MSEPPTQFFYNCLVPYLDKVEKFAENSGQFFTVFEKVVSGAEWLDVSSLFAKLINKLKDLPVVETGNDSKLSLSIVLKFR